MPFSGRVGPWARLPIAVFPGLSFRFYALSVGQAPVDSGKGFEVQAAVATEAQSQAPAGLDQPGGEVHQLLHDGLEPPPLGAVPHRGLVAEQAELPDVAQDVVGERGAAHHQTVDLEFARGQAFQIHVGFEFAVKLLAGAVILVEGDDLLGGQVQGGPPAFQLDLGIQQALAVLVGGALDDPNDPATGELLLDAVLVGPDMGLPDIEDRDAFARSRVADRAFGKSPPVPVAFALPPGVPLQDVVGSFVASQFNAGLPGIVGRIEPHQQRRGGQRQRLVQDPGEKGDEVLLAVLGALAVLDLQQPPFQGQIGGDRSVAVVPLVGARHPLLLGSGVVHGEHVDIQRNVPHRQRRHQRPRRAQELGGAKVHNGSKRLGMLLHPLPQGRFGGNLLQAQGFPEKAVLTKAADRLEVTLAETQQADVTADDIGMGDGPLFQPGNGRMKCLHYPGHTK